MEKSKSMQQQMKKVNTLEDDVKKIKKILKEAE
jgi:hypothetical protein